MRKGLIALALGLFLMSSVKAQVTDSLRWAITSQVISKDIATFKMLRDSSESVLGKNHFFYGELHKMHINSKLVLQKLGMEILIVPADTVNASSQQEIRVAVVDILNRWSCYGIDCHNFIDDFLRNKYVQKQEDKILIQVFIINVELISSYLKEFPQ